MVEEKVKWVSWQKDRTFVRAVEGKYAELVRRLYDQPRVIKTKEIPFPEGKGPQWFGKFLLGPSLTSTPTQAIEAHFNVLAPGGRSQKHGHMNSAVAYVLEGKGYEIHDGKRQDWEAGDVCVIRNGCVHQHFNANQDKPAKILIMKSKPLFMFFNLFFQKNIEMPPDTAMPGWENFKPED